MSAINDLAHLSHLKSNEEYNSLTYDVAYGSENNLWSLLLMTGYITADRGADYSSDYVDLRIPNREITNIFKTAVVDHFNRTVD